MRTMIVLMFTLLAGPPTNAPISTSKSNLLQSVKLGLSAVGGFVCPLGLWRSVPDTTTVEARP